LEVVARLGRVVVRTRYNHCTLRFADYECSLDFSTQPQRQQLQCLLEVECLRHRPFGAVWLSQRPRLASLQEVEMDEQAAVGMVHAKKQAVHRPDHWVVQKAQLEALQICSGRGSDSRRYRKPHGTASSRSEFAH
jgi:hypothetical protein